MKNDPPITINYVSYHHNPKGDRSLRKIIPKGFRYGLSEYHEGGPQWFLEAFDVGKGADRTFALRDIERWAFTDPA